MKHYRLFDSIASGGMGTVHYGRATSGAGLSRIVAVKRMHGDLARDPVCLAMFRDELRLATRVRHPNVVATTDMVEQDGELLLVMEYVQGESLQDLIARAALAGHRVPPNIAVSIACGILQGLEAAHDAKNEAGEPLGIVHRDVSPENVLVGRDGIARLLDFGIARGVGRKHVTRVGEIKGKPSYLAPEQILDGGKNVDRCTDIYGAAIVLWEALTGKRLFDGDTPTITLSRVLTEVVEPPSALAGPLPEGLDEVVMRGLSRNPEERYATALEMARALSGVCGALLSFEVGEWVQATAADSLSRQAQTVSRLENTATLTGKRLPELSQLRNAEEPDDVPPESTRTNMALTPVRPNGASPVDRMSAWLERAPRARQALFASAVSLFCFAAGVVVVSAATATAHPRTAPVAAATLSPLKDVSPAAAFALVEEPVAAPAPPPSAAPPSKHKKHGVTMLAPRKPAVIDDGF
jgi:serine/threonine-protein kinase